MAQEQRVSESDTVFGGEAGMIARNPYDVAVGLLKDACIHSNAPPMPAGKRGVIVGALNGVLDEGDDDRYRVLAFIFAPDVGLLSTKQLNPGEWEALWEWVGSYQDDDGWHTSPEFKTECKMILSLLNKEKAKWNQELEKLLKKPS